MDPEETPKEEATPVRRTSRARKINSRFSGDNVDESYRKLVDRITASDKNRGKVKKETSTASKPREEIPKTTELVNGNIEKVPVDKTTEITTANAATTEQTTPEAAVGEKAAVVPSQVNSQEQEKLGGSVIVKYRNSVDSDSSDDFNAAKVDPEPMPIKRPFSELEDKTGSLNDELSAIADAFDKQPKVVLCRASVDRRLSKKMRLSSASQPSKVASAGLGPKNNIVLKKVKIVTVKSPVLSPIGSPVRDLSRQDTVVPKVIFSSDGEDDIPLNQLLCKSEPKPDVKNQVTPTNQPKSEKTPNAKTTTKTKKKVKNTQKLTPKTVTYTSKQPIPNGPESTNAEPTTATPTVKKNVKISTNIFKFPIKKSNSRSNSPAAKPKLPKRKCPAAGTIQRKKKQKFNRSKLEQTGSRLVTLSDLVLEIPIATENKSPMKTPASVSMPMKSEKELTPIKCTVANTPDKKTPKPEKSPAKLDSQSSTFKKGLYVVESDLGTYVVESQCKEDSNCNVSTKKSLPKLSNSTTLSKRLDSPLAGKKKVNSSMRSASPSVKNPPLKSEMSEQNSNADSNSLFEECLKRSDSPLSTHKKKVVLKRKSSQRSDSPLACSKNSQLKLDILKDLPVKQTDSAIQKTENQTTAMTNDTPEILTPAEESIQDADLSMNKSEVRTNILPVSKDSCSDTAVKCDEKPDIDTEDSVPSDNNVVVTRTEVKPVLPIVIKTDSQETPLIDCEDKSSLEGPVKKEDSEVSPLQNHTISSSLEDCDKVKTENSSRRDSKEPSDRRHSDRRGRSTTSSKDHKHHRRDSEDSDKKYSSSSRDSKRSLTSRSPERKHKSDKSRHRSDSYSRRSSSRHGDSHRRHSKSSRRHDSSLKVEKVETDVKIDSPCPVVGHTPKAEPCRETSVVPSQPKVEEVPVSSTAATCQVTVSPQPQDDVTHLKEPNTSHENPNVDPNAVSFDCQNAEFSTLTFDDLNKSESEQDPTDVLVPVSETETPSESTVQQNETFKDKNPDKSSLKAEVSIVDANGLVQPPNKPAQESVKTETSPQTTESTELKTELATAVTKSEICTQNEPDLKAENHSVEQPEAGICQPEEPNTEEVSDTIPTACEELIPQCSMPSNFLECIPLPDEVSAVTSSPNGPLTTRVDEPMEVDSPTDTTPEEPPMPTETPEETEQRHQQVVAQRLASFEHLTENEYLIERKKSHSKEVRRMVCDCLLSKEEIANDEYGCGDDCLNRLLMIECGSRCPLRERCLNKQFQNKVYANVEVFNAEDKGCGVRATHDIDGGVFIMEYVGEVFDYREFRKRRKEYAKESTAHFYFMALRSDTLIDATRKGNISRFVNHSCDPNAETQKWTVNGDVRVGFFTTRSVSAGEEINFDYRLERYGREPQKCYCGTQMCRGWLGEAPDEKTKEEKEEDRKRELKDKRRREEKRGYFDDLNLANEIDKLALHGLRNGQDTLTLSRLMVRAEDTDSRLSLLHLLTNGQQACKRLFLDYHGLKLLWSWMADLCMTSQNTTLKIEILQVLGSLPITNRTQLSDSRVLSVVERWSKQDHSVESDSVSPPSDTDKTVNKSTTDKPDGVEAVDTTEAVNGSPADSLDSTEGCKSGFNLLSNLLKEASKDLNNTAAATPSEVETDQPPRDSIALLADKLTTSWSGLNEAFRIPKKQRLEIMKEHEREVERGYKESLSKETSAAYNSYYERGRRSPERRNKRARRDRDSWPKFTECSEQDKYLTKEQRRHKFAQKVAQEEEEAKERKDLQEVMWNLHLHRCSLTAQDPLLTPIFEPNGQYYWEPISTSWQPYTGTEMNLPVPGNYGSTPEDETPLGLYPTTPHNLPLAYPSPGLFDMSALSQVPEPESAAVMPPEAVHITLPPDWKLARTADGLVYFYHSKTRYAQWQTPTAQLHKALISKFDLESDSELDSDSTLSSTDSDEFSSDEEKEDSDRASVVCSIEGGGEKMLRRPKGTGKRSEKLVQERVISPILFEDREAARLERRLAKDRAREEARRERWTSTTKPQDNEDDSFDEEPLDEPPKVIRKPKHIKSKSKTRLNVALADDSEGGRKVKDTFRAKMATFIVSVLNPYRRSECKRGRITSTEDFKYLARKLTHFVMVKELKQLLRVEELDCSDSVKHKTKEFVRKYMSKYGHDFIRDPNDTREY